MKQIKTERGEICNIYKEKIENQELLVLDFSIKKYKVFNQGWHDYQFEKNTIINDKLYLDKVTANTVLKYLTYFIDTGSLAGINVEANQRGFKYLDLKDVKGNIISIQESSAASDYYIWFGCLTQDNIFLENNGEKTKYTFPSGDVLVNDRLHLNIKVTQELKQLILNEIEEMK